MKNQNRTQLFKQVSLVVFGLLSMSLIYAELSIPTNINNAVQTIKEIRLTTDGTNSGSLMVLLNGSGASNTLQVSGNIIAGKSMGADDGTLNKIFGLFSSIVGGFGNFIKGDQSTVVGGNNNILTGTRSTIIGGQGNKVNASDATAGGQNAQALHNYTWVWSDNDISYDDGSSDPKKFPSFKEKTFLIRAKNGVGINTNDPLTGGLSVNGKIGSVQYCDLSGGNCVFPSQIITGTKTSLTHNYVTKWSSGNLANSQIYDNGSSVGIGIATPSGKFHVYGGDTYLWGLRLGYGTAIAAISTDDATKPLSFQINGSEKMSITTGGNVGIGTNSPAEKLAINGNIKPTGYLYKVANDNQSIIQTTRSDNTQTGNIMSDGWGNFLIDKKLAVGSTTTINGSTAALYVNGNVGIGTTGPTEKLEVAGNIKSPGFYAKGTGVTANGNYATAIGYNSKAGGNYSISMGNNSIANGESSVAIGQNTAASLQQSTAIGYNAKANGYYSTAIGYSSESPGSNSVAIGLLAKANGYDSLAIGSFVTAQGGYSTAMGNNTYAKGSYSTAMGHGYGITYGAFGDSSTSMGEYTIANGYSSTAMGKGTIANGYYATAMGAYTQANQSSSTAMGESTIANGNSSTAMGRNTTANGFASTAMGYNTQANQSSSTSMGESTIANGNSSTAMGVYTTANGYASTAMGEYTTANGYASTVMGAYNIGLSNAILELGIGSMDYYSWTPHLANVLTVLNNGALYVDSFSPGGPGCKYSVEGLHRNSVPVGGPYVIANAFGDGKNLEFNNVYDDGYVFSAESMTVDGQGMSYLGGLAYDIVYGYASSTQDGSCDPNLVGYFTQCILGDIGGYRDGPDWSLSFYCDVVKISGVDTVIVSNDTRTPSFSISQFGDVGIGFSTTGYQTKGEYPLEVLGNFKSSGLIAKGQGVTAVGDNSTAMGLNTTASGSYSTAMGAYTTAAGGFSTAMGQSTTASGDSSTAMGKSTTAAGGFSTAMGQSTTAKGFASTAMGNATTANGMVSTAMGLKTTASGAYSTAMGRETIAVADYSIAMGKYNVGLTGAILEVGNGTSTSASARSNAFTILNNGNVGIGVTNPSSALEVSGTISVSTLMVDKLVNRTTSNISFSGAFLPDTGASTQYQTIGTLTTPWKSLYAGGIIALANGNVGIGTNPTEKLEVAGNIKSPGFYAKGIGVTANGPNATAIGQDTNANGPVSTAMGYHTNANGPVSTAMGQNTTAAGAMSIAMGLSTTANGAMSMAMGLSTTAAGQFSTAIGNYTVANGDSSTAMGVNTTATEYASTAMGYVTQANGFASTAMGYVTQANGNSSTAMGFSTTANGSSTTAMGVGTQAYGDYSTAMGDYTTANGYASTAMGIMNQGYWDSIFEIGIGGWSDYAGNPTTANALTIYNNGALNIQTTARNVYAYSSNMFSITFEVTDCSDEYPGYYCGATSDGLPVRIASPSSDGYGSYYTSSMSLDGTPVYQTNVIGDILMNGISSSNVPSGLYMDGDYSSIYLTPLDEGWLLGTAPLASVGNGGSYLLTDPGIPNSAISVSPLANVAMGADISHSTSTTDDKLTVYGTLKTSGLWAKGKDVTADGAYSTAMGYQSEAAGAYSTAMGSSLTNGQYATAMGKSTASGDYSTAMGFSYAYGAYSTAMGSSIANGAYSTAMGRDTKAIGMGALAIGYYNVGITGALFEVGRGSGPADTARKNAMTILTNGNVGIGTGAPGYVLDVVGTGKFSAGLRSPKYCDINGANCITPQSYLTSESDPNFNSWYNTSPQIGFWTEAYGWGNHATAGYLKIESDPKVGTLTSGKWCTTNGSTISCTTNSPLTSESDPNFNSWYNTSPQIGFWTSAYTFTSNASTNNRLVIDTANNRIGIGTSTPGEKLEVNGNIKAVGFYYSSDITLKKDIKSIDNALEKVNQLNGYSFSWKATDKNDLGVIAQEVEKVFPDIVHTDSNGIKSVEYGNLVAPIIEAIKELSQKVESLFTKYVDQEARIDALEQRLQKLEAHK